MAGWINTILHLILFFLIASPTAQAAPPPVSGRPPNVLILNSYHKGYDWADKETEGVLEKLSVVSPGLDEAIEYLDAKRFPDSRHLALVSDYLEKKYQGISQDVIIVLDNPALDLMLSPKQACFKKPVRESSAQVKR